MKNFIDKVDFHNLEAQKYWTPVASWAPERKKALIQDAIFSGDYVGSRKMDGAFYKFVKDEDGNMELLGRSKGVKGDYLNKIDWVPQLHEFFNKLPNGTCLLGEIYFPNNEGSSNVTTIMGCLKEKAIARQGANDKLNYYIFDVLAWNKRSFLKEPIEKRIEYVEYIENSYWGWSDYIQYAQYYDGKKLWRELQSILASGGEGVVITKKGTLYQPGKRPARQTIKVKKELQETIDVIILDSIPPTRLYNGKEILTWQYWENIRTGEKLQGDFYKRYSDGEPIEPVTQTYWNGWAGSLSIGVRKGDKVVRIGALSGLSFEVLENWKNYVGKVAEISGMEVLKTGGIRHPRFVRWRDDLRPRDTDWNRIFGEEIDE